MKIRNIASTANWNKISLSKSTKIAQIKTLQLIINKYSFTMYSFLHHPNLSKTEHFVL